LRPTIAGTSIEVTGGFERPPMERTAGTARLNELARGVASEMGQDVREGGTGGGSDGNFTAALGRPTLRGLGADGAGPPGRPRADWRRRARPARARRARRVVVAGGADCGVDRADRRWRWLTRTRVVRASQIQAAR